VPSPVRRSIRTEVPATGHSLMTRRFASRGQRPLSSLAALVVLATAVFHGPATAAASADAPAGACTGLPDGNWEGITISVAETVRGSGDRPDYCRIIGTVAPSVGFELRLPERHWNGRFLMSGCGAYCGEILADRDGYANAINFALERGYAVAKSDSGHQGSRVRTVWAMDNPTGEVLYAHAWVPLATDAARRILRKYYGRAERFAYFAGCSNGGRTALRVAQSYPALYDGIVSGCPTIDLAGAAGLQGLWLTRVLQSADGELLLTPDKIPLLAEAVRDRCDHLDGLRDRIISRPEACDFDPASLLCEQGGDGTGCLTQAEATAAAQLYRGVIDKTGHQVYPGLPYGSEPYWQQSIVGTTNSGHWYLAELGNDFFRYLAFPDDPGADYSADDFSLEHDLAELEFSRELFNADSTDLSSFRASGGKLLLYHGLADPIIVPQQSIDYYRAVIERMGSRQTVQEFFRLFLIPGADHCWAMTGEAPDLFDPLQVIEEWVEQDKPPRQIKAYQFLDDGKRVTGRQPLRTRPLCPYPLRARYDGQGSPFVAQSFVCEEPD